MGGLPVFRSRFAFARFGYELAGVVNQRRHPKTAGRRSSPAAMFVARSCPVRSFAPAAQRRRRKSGKARDHHHPDGGFGDQGRCIAVDKRVDCVRARWERTTFACAGARIADRADNHAGKRGAIREADKLLGFLIWKDVQVSFDPSSASAGQLTRWTVDGVPAPSRPQSASEPASCVTTERS